MSQRKSYTVNNSFKDKKTNTLSLEVVATFSTKVNNAMKVANREFQKKQKISVEKASDIVLNG